MGDKEHSKDSSPPQNWQQILKALVRMIHNQQSKLGTLAKGRKLLEDRVRMQQEQWVSDVRLLEDQISEMKGDLELKEKAASVDRAKLELAFGLKQREAFFTKLFSEYTNSDLESFKAWFDLHCNKFSDSKGGVEDGDKSNSGTKSSKSTKQDKQRSKRLESDLKKLKQQYDKLSSAKSSEVSALVAEKKFVWNQYKVMENDYTTKLRSKNSEVEQADAKIKNLLASMEKLESSNKEKDDKIGILVSKVSKMEADSTKFKEEISKLSSELDLLRKAGSSSSTPVLNHCHTGTKSYSLRGSNGANDRIAVTAKKDSSSTPLPDLTKDSKKGIRSSKRKADDVITISETPKLFSSRFKVPKLKNNASPHV